MQGSRGVSDGAATPRSRFGIWTLLAAALVVASVLAAWAAMPADAQDEVRDPQVVGGTAVPNGKYRFMTSVQDRTGLTGTYRGHFCGGTLIDRDSVLTAAHCMQGKVASGLRVAVGTTVLTSGQGQVRNVARIRSHPSFNLNTYAYDAAVLTLSSPVTGIAPVRLATSAQNGLETPGRSLTVAGWGNTIRQSPSGEEPNSSPNRMREAQVPVVSDGKADRIYRDYIPALMVAAGKTGKDTCQGDSGGPMFARTAVGFTQVGITSFGIGCGSPGYPGVYAEVNNPSIRSFIINAAR